MGLFDFLTTQGDKDFMAAAAEREKRKRDSENIRQNAYVTNATRPGMTPDQQTALNKRYLAEQRLKGFGQAAMGTGDFINTVANLALRDVGVMTGQKYDDVYQFGMPSQTLANLANTANAALTGQQAVTPQQVPGDIRNQADKERGLISMIPTGAEDLAGPLLATVAMAAKPVGVLGDIADASKPAGGVLDALRTGDDVPGFTAYHGSPHQFDKFDFSKIGTGEGAQAYGKGGYFAGNEEVAKGYRDKLQEMQIRFKVGDTVYTRTDAPKTAQEEAANYLMDISGWDTTRQAGGKPLNIDKAVDQAILSLPHNQFTHDPNDIRNVLIDWSAQNKKLLKQPKGAMYEVNIKADPAKFLDYDAKIGADDPLVQQIMQHRSWTAESLAQAQEDAKRVYEEALKPGGSTDTAMEYMKRPEVRFADFFERTGKPKEWTGRDPRPTGSDLLSALGEEGLRDVGVPGIKYLDAGSRWTPTNLPNNPIANEARKFLEAHNGDPAAALKAFHASNPVEQWATTERAEIEKVINAAGKPSTHNYVVFDDKLVNIIRRNGGLLGDMVEDIKGAPGGGVLDALKASDEAAPPTGGVLGDLAKTDNAVATVGDLNNADVTFEGLSPGDFTDTAQWARFGEKYGVPNLGSKDAKAWEASLVPYKSNSGKTFTIPGGIDSTEPFTYYDLLHIKQQGISPNDMPPEMHQKIHDRMVKTMSPAGEVSQERLFNQLALAQISPNQPLTPNELAVARSMAKNPEDLDRFGAMIPWKHGDEEMPKQIMKNPDGTDMMRKRTWKNKKTGETHSEMVPVTMRKYYGDKIANDLGLGAANKTGTGGGLGARGTADYTRIAETAQRIKEDPDFFRFRGEGEGGGNSAANWANFVERLTSQTPGLSAKTGSFGAVWQNPAMADISAVDRHMASLFDEAMFPSREAFESFAADTVAKYNKTAAGKKKPVTDYNKLGDTVKNDAIFGYLNQHPEPKLRGTQAPKGGRMGPVNQPVNAAIPAHLRPENANWIKDPVKVKRISDAYKRVLEENAKAANAAGQSTFASQWMLWDRIRNRLEPHEIMFPGLEKLPRMSMDQMRSARKALKEAGYMSSAKSLIDEKTGKAVKQLAPVRALPSASRAAYFGFAPLGLLPFMANEEQPGPTREKARRMKEET